MSSSRTSSNSSLILSIKRNTWEFMLQEFSCLNIPSTDLRGEQGIWVLLKQGIYWNA